MYLGIDIGGTKCAVIKADMNGSVVEKIAFKTTGFKETLENIISAAKKLLPFCAIGISCGGPLDSEKGIIMSPPNLPGWDDVHIKNILTAEFGCPVYLENDANACALAEWQFGAARGYKNAVFLTFGTGLGAGLILDGRLYRGTNGNAGEVGHIRLSDEGPVGYGKEGSFEGFCSGGGIARLGRKKAEELLRQGNKCRFCSDASELDSITARSIADAAFCGDEAALEVYRASAEKLGLGISFLIDILNPEVIVIGSVFERSEALFRDIMEEVIRREALSVSSEVCTVKAAELKNEIGDIAAISVAINGYKNDR